MNKISHYVYSLILLLYLCNDLKGGSNIFKFDWTTPTPHIDKLLLIKSSSNNLEDSFDTKHLNKVFSNQWIQQLTLAKKNTKSPLNKWRELIDNPLKTIGKNIFTPW